MAVFKCYVDDSVKKTLLGTYNTKESAIERCVKKIPDLGGSHDEMEDAAEALEFRGYYCVGWSNNELSIEEE